MAETAALPVRDAYRLWAPHYDRENALTALEDRVVSGVSPPATGLTLLDAGCGTGRRTSAVASGPGMAVGVDLVPEMLAGAGPERAAAGSLAAADVRALPFGAGRFDLIWLRLVAGHLPSLEPAYRELARVATPAARLVVSDFHPAAVAAGHARTFRDADGRVHAVEHHAHGVDDHARASGAAGWTMERVLEAPAGEPERPYYTRAGRSAQLERERDLPLVLVMCFRR